MKGLTSQELEEVRAFVQKHHKFGYVPDTDRVTEYPFMIKYIDTVYDSRDQTYWCIVFRNGASGVCFATNHWNALNLPPKGWKYHSLYDLCMAYLKGEFVPKEEFYRENKGIDDIKVMPILVLDCHDNGVWFVKNIKTGRHQDFSTGDVGKLAAYEHMYRNQSYDW